MNLKEIELILVAPKKEMCEAWQEKFGIYEHVNIFHGKFEDVEEYDCLVSPANSYGIMDGGLDLLIRNYFGMELQIRVQEKIKKEFFSEQPVGTSMIVRTGHSKHPFLAHTPTMRIPKNISKTDNVYFAMYAMLCAVAKHNQENNQKIQKVLCPGLGTGAGYVPVTIAAEQMELAYKNFYNPPRFYSWFYIC